MKKILLSSSFAFFCLFSFNLMANQSNSIIYYCESHSLNAWDEDTILACRGSFYPAVLNSLLYLDNNVELRPLSLESFDWDFKNKYYKLKLKENLYFHNNRKVTSKDLEFSILRHLFAKYPNTGNTMQINLKGSEKIRHGQEYKSGLVEGLKILDERTVAIVPAKLNPYFLYSLSHFSFSLVPMEELNSDLLTWKKWPVGSGPYKIIEADYQKKIFYLSLINKLQYPKAAHHIIYELNRIYEPDITLKDSIAANTPKYKQDELLVPLYRRVIEFNYGNSLGANKHFRRAVSLAMSRNEITKSVDIPVKPLYELLTPGNIGRLNLKEDIQLTDSIESFKRVLGKNFMIKIFKIPYTEDSSYLGSKYRDVIKTQLKNAGLNIQFIEVSKNIYNPFGSEFKDSPFYLLSTETDFFDPILNFAKYSKISPSINSHGNDKILETLLDETKEASSRDILNERLKNISRYFYDNRILVPLFEIPTVAYYNPFKISSIGNQFGGVIFYLQHLELN
ncbi:ABC transporter substrate-binding protein [Silvanigrella aquatica]|uniref:Solute-binding protein family 5 domain-containing protein n=1 Tax=Silvanigrella aquatica TaxID=1915309 RepID=A0A1L4CYE1_9BACT|nr:ABC transporter substrate-binding protein [Silvanigrella aquatica]APJ02969.1 hypothetical protein AXG55_03180 [Silvanigrella aquatica]